MKLGDIVEEKGCKFRKQGLIGRIVKPVKRDDSYVWIIPRNDDFLKTLAVNGHPIGILKSNIIKVNGKPKGE